MDEPVEIAPALVRWTAPHPEWKGPSEPGSPDDWDQIVGCVLYEVPDAVVLIDPLLPAGGREKLLDWLDARGGAPGEDVHVDRRGLARLMRPLLELPIERVLVSHGEPVLHDGHVALARAIAEAEGPPAG